MCNDFVVIPVIVSPEGSVSPLNTVYEVGDIAILECSSIGGPGNLFQWEMNGLFIGNDGVLSLEGINASHGGTYTCIISNAAGNNSVYTTLYVAPYIDSPLEEETLAVNGSSVNITCNAAGFPVPKVMWIDSHDSDISNTSLLELSPVLFGDEGTYYCVASTEINNTRFTATNETTLIGNFN